MMSWVTRRKSLGAAALNLESASSQVFIFSYPSLLLKSSCPVRHLSYFIPSQKSGYPSDFKMRFSTHEAICPSNIVISCSGSPFYISETKQQTWYRVAKSENSIHWATKYIYLKITDRGGEMLIPGNIWVKSPHRAMDYTDLPECKRQYKLNKYTRV